jgi:uncharacterized membrane protein YsdA (DUF1294 family)
MPHATRKPTRRRFRSPYRQFGMLATSLALIITIVLVTMLNIHWYIAWIIGWSVLTFTLYGLDKQAARKKNQRVPEVVLHGVALIGGVIGGWIGRAYFRHKTLHASFLAVLLFATLLHTGITWYLFFAP